MPSDQDITLKVILEHIQALRGAMEERFERLEGQMDRLEGRMEKIEGRMGGVESKLDLLSTQITNIDQRLDEVEVKRLPALEAKVA